MRPAFAMNREESIPELPLGLRVLAPRNTDEAPYPSPVTIADTSCDGPLSPDATEQQRIRKRAPKSVTRPAEEWEYHRPTITRLIIEEGRKLDTVIDIMKQNFDFTASPTQYKHKLKAWGVAKNLTKKEKWFMIRKEQERLAASLPKESIFTRRGVPVDLQILTRFEQEEGINRGRPIVEVSSQSDIEVHTPVGKRLDHRTHLSSRNWNNVIASESKRAQAIQESVIRTLVNIPGLLFEESRGVSAIADGLSTSEDESVSLEGSRKRGVEESFEKQKDAKRNSV